MSDPPIRRVGFVLIVAALIATAGCSGFPGSPNEAETPTETPDATEMPESTPDDGGAAATHEGETTRESAASGEFLLVLDGESAYPDGDVGSDFWLNESTDEWHVASEDLTLASALEAFEYEASETSLSTDDGEYDASANDTTLDYRVNGVPVDPEEYELEDGDRVHVIAIDGEVSTPGTYLDDSQPHPHGALNVTIEGDGVNLTGPEYEMNDEYFHFHENSSEPYWHGHSHTLTLEYALSSFNNTNYDDGAFTIDGRTYEDDFSTNVTYLVRGEEVDPSSYVLRDGDRIRVIVEDA